MICLILNCIIELDLSQSKEYVISEISRTDAVEENNSALATIVTGAKVHINSTKLYVPVFTFSINNCINFLENMKQGFKRRVSWNKYRSEIT